MIPCRAARRGRSIPLGPDTTRRLLAATPNYDREELRRVAEDRAAGAEDVLQVLAQHVEAGDVDALIEDELVDSMDEEARRLLRAAHDDPRLA